MLISEILLLLPLAAASTTQKRFEFGQLVLDSVGVDQNIRILTWAVGNWTKEQTILGAIPILSDEQTLEQSINTATSNAQQSPPLTSDQAADIGALVENYIIPDTATLLTALEAKKQDFTDVGALSIVQNSISTLRTDQSAYSSALLSITPAADQQQGQQDAAIIDGYFADAVTYFGS